MGKPEDREALVENSRKGYRTGNTLVKRQRNKKQGSQREDIENRNARELKVGRIKTNLLCFYILLYLIL